MLGVLGKIYSSVASWLPDRRPIPPPDLDLIREQLEGFDIRTTRRLSGVITKIEDDHIVIDNRYWMPARKKARKLGDLPS